MRMFVAAAAMALFTTASVTAQEAQPQPQGGVTAQPGQPSGGCACCRNMTAMMQSTPSQGTGSMPGMQHGNPGASSPATPGAPAR